MELVYLWVEDYKNIKRQGFNFSPRFDCKFYNEYNDEGKLKDNCKLEINPKEHIENFFGNNINVTAIVGKNGSGKSSVLNKIREYFLIYSFYIYFDSSTEIIYTLYNYPNINIKNNTKFKYKKREEDFFSKLLIPYFDYSFTNNLSDYTNILKPIYPSKSSGVIDLNKESIKNQENIIRNNNFLKEKKQLDKFEKFFQPQSLEIRVKLDNFNENSKFSLKKDKKEEINKIRKELEKEVGLDAIESIKNISSMLSEINSFENLNKCLTNEFLRAEEAYKIDNLDNWLNNIKSIIKDKNLIKIKEKSDFNNHTILRFNINILKDTEIDILLSGFQYNPFIIDLIDMNNKKLSDLSFGEQQLLNILNQLLILANQEYTEEHPETGESINYDINNFIILLDEIDISFHPDWQKRIIKYIIDFLKLIPNKKFHLVFTTHSPFLLSDIPKENIIFLNDKSSIKQTFGANIHTLLSDSFFMENGLMGEFAKGKIEEVIEFLRQDKITGESDNHIDDNINLTINKVESIISIIGEPLLQIRLKKMLIDYKTRNNLFTESDIEQQIKELQIELQNMRQNG